MSNRLNDEFINRWVLFPFLFLPKKGKEDTLTDMGDHK